MQIGPSNNLLEALSQLQGSSPASRPQAARPVAKASEAKAVDFAAEVKRSAPAISAPVVNTAPAALSAPQQTVASVEHPEYPVLGRYINILV